MSTFNKMNNNQPNGSVEFHQENGLSAVRRGLAMFPAFLALLLMGVLLLVWQPGRVAAAPDAPVFEGVEWATVGTNSGTEITIPVPSGTAEGDLLIAPVIHGFATTTIVPPAGWTLIDAGPCDGDRCAVGAWYRVASAAEPANYTFAWQNGQRAVGAILR